MLNTLLNIEVFTTVVITAKIGYIFTYFTYEWLKTTEEKTLINEADFELNK